MATLHNQLTSNSKRASDIIENKLRRMIISLELPPGAKISEAELIQHLDCGRTPLREALQRLAEEYLVISVPRKGISIAELSITDYVQLIEAVSNVEGITARLASKRIKEEEIDELESLLQQTREAREKDDILSVAELDFAFHHHIAKYSRNRYLSDTIDRLHRLTSRFIYLAWKNGGNISISLDEHEDILEAFRNRDENTAQQKTFEHTQNAKERIIKAL